VSANNLLPLRVQVTNVERRKYGKNIFPKHVKKESVGDKPCTEKKHGG
jgi:hypothetical protein